LKASTPDARPDPEGLLRLHDELDEMSSGASMIQGVLSASAVGVSLFLGLRILQLASDVGLRVEVGLISLVSVSVLAGQQLWSQRQRRSLRQRIVEIESVLRAADQPVAPAEAPRQTGTMDGRETDAP
jgi:hypothetical protein